MSLEIVRVDDVRRLAIDACLACGAGEAMSRSLVNATLSAETEGKPGLGFPHFMDYLRAMKEGRINPRAIPDITNPLPAIIVCDANDGIAQHGFDLAFDKLLRTASMLGVSVFSLRNSFSAGEIGYYVRQIAKEGYIALAFANAHALMAPSAGAQKTFSTNPLAFGVPLGAGIAPLVFDQASSATAFVNILQAAADGTSLPSGWAIDENGHETTDPVKAANGALLPFGGYKGANIAMMVEMLAAGFTGASWSLDAGAFNAGDRPPKSGMTIIVLKPDTVEPHFMERSLMHLERLVARGLRRSGSRAAKASGKAETISMLSGVLLDLRQYSEGAHNIT